MNDVKVNDLEFCPKSPLMETNKKLHLVQRRTLSLLSISQPQNTLTKKTFKISITLKIMQNLQLSNG